MQALNYPSNQNPIELAQYHFQWAEKHMNQFWREIDFGDHDFSADRPIRLGMLSGDFCRHPVGRFAMLLCHHLDLERFDLFIYSNNHETDDLKPSFEEHALWCDVTAMTDDEAAKKIREDRIDILLDLSGHTKGNRLGIVARKPAPIQAALFAYPNTTGLAAVDYRDNQRQPDRWCSDKRTTQPESGPVCEQRYRDDCLLCGRRDQAGYRSDLPGSF